MTLMLCARLIRWRAMHDLPIPPRWRKLRQSFRAKEAMGDVVVARAIAELEVQG